MPLPDRLRLTGLPDELQAGHLPRLGEVLKAGVALNGPASRQGTECGNRDNC